MHPILAAYKGDFQKSTEHLKVELNGIRTGRANAAVVENIMVLAYGNPIALKGVASIGVPDAKTISIDPWDKSLMKEIEKGIRDSGVGLNPVNEGTLIRISMPQMTEENRKALIKIVREKVEESRVAIRGVREGCKNEITAAEKNGDIAEDERYKLTDQLDAMTADYNENVKKIGEDKEKEVMTI